MDQRRLDSLVKTYAKVNNLPPGLVRAVIDTESHGDPSAISRAGAQGLMQLMPGTQAMYGVANPFDPDANVAGGTHYLHDLLVRFHNDVPLALAAYNAGPATVDLYHGIPPFAETRAYVAKVSAEFRTF